MADIILPTILQGPAYITHGGVTTFVAGDVAVSLTRDTWNPETAQGPLGERLKATSAKVTLTPVGMLTAANLNYYYAAHLSPSTTVGRSALNGALVIVSIPSAKSYSYAKGALVKPPNLQLGPGKTAFGSMDFLVIGDPAVQPLTAAQLKTSETAVDPLSTGFEEASITSDIYKAAWGASPFDAMGSMDGFEIEFGQTMQNIMAGDIGIADVILTGLSIGATFMPSSLTETQIDTLLRIDGAEALLPGQEIARGAAATPGTAKDLVITGTQLSGVFTAKAVGAKDAGFTYKMGEHRLKAVSFVNSRRWTTGAETPLFAHSGVS